METRTITLTSAKHFGRKVPPRAFGEVLRTIPTLTRQSIRMAFEGRSQARGRKPGWLAAASDIRFVGHEGDDETRLFFEAPTFGEAAEELYSQQEIWPTRPAPRDTGFDALADVVLDVASGKRDSERFDRPLLKRVAELGRGLDRVFQGCLIEARGDRARQSARVDRQVIEQAESLTRAMPRPQQARIAGVLDMIRASTNTLAIRLETGEEVKGILTVGSVVDLHDLFQKPVTLLGRAVYRPSGALLRVDAVEVRQMQEEDEFFARIPEPTMRPLNMMEVQREQRGKGGVAVIIGRWPGDESDAEIDAALRELS